jgi:hypothetical protein
MKINFDYIAKEGVARPINAREQCFRDASVLRS